MVGNQSIAARLHNAGKCSPLGLSQHSSNNAMAQYLSCKASEHSICRSGAPAAVQCVKCAGSGSVLAAELVYKRYLNHTYVNSLLADSSACKESDGQRLGATLPAVMSNEKVNKGRHSKLVRCVGH